MTKLQIRIEASENRKDTVDELAQYILAHIQGSELEKEVNKKYFSFLLPKNESPKFPKLLHRIKKLSEKGTMVKSYNKILYLLHGS